MMFSVVCPFRLFVRAAPAFLAGARVRASAVQWCVFFVARFDVVRRLVGSCAHSCACNFVVLLREREVAGTATEIGEVGRNEFCCVTNVIIISMAC